MIKATTGGQRGQQLRLPGLASCGEAAENSRVGGGARVRWPPSAAQTAQTDLPYAAFAKTQRNQVAREGIKATKRTSSYSP